MSENDPDTYSICLTNEYEVLRRIFNFLSAPDLETCSEVCEEWKKVVCTTMKKRRLIQAFMFEHGTEDPFILSDALLTLVFDNVSNVDHSKILFMTNELIQIFAKCGILYIHNGIKHFYRQHRLGSTGKYSTVLRFPPNDQIIIKTININTGQILTEEEMEEKIGIPLDIPIKAVMLFAYSHYNDSDQILLNAALIKKCINNRKFCAFAGCWVHPDPSVSSSVALSITLFAGENVEAGSCVLDPSHRTFESITNKIEDFSKRVTIIDNSVMMIFRCYSRIKVRKRYKYLPSGNVETWECDAVAKYFASSPLFGCYGTGEFGHDYPTDIPDNKKSRLSFRAIELAFSTVLLYIGYKK